MLCRDFGFREHSAAKPVPPLLATAHRRLLGCSTLGTNVNSIELVPIAGGNHLAIHAGKARVLGRSADCDLPVYDASISRAHVELSLTPEGLRLRDLGSTNGIQVNGTRVQEHTAREGDTVTFGAISFRVWRSATPVATEPQAPAPAPVESAPAEPQIRARLPVGIATYTTEKAVPGQSAAFLDLLCGVSADHTARKAAALLEVGTALARAGDTDELFLQVVQQGFEVLRADRVSLMTVEGDDLALAPRVARSRSPQAEVSPIPRSLLYQALTEAEALLSADVGVDDRFDGKSARQLLGRSALCVPLVGTARQVLGLLYLEREGGRRPFLEEDLRFMVAFANIAGLALQNQRLRETAQREAQTLARLRRYLSPNLELAIGYAPNAWSGVDRGGVTLLVAELKGVAELVENLSAADLGAFLGAFYSQLTEVIFQYGGSLNNVFGPSLVAVWGAPFAAANDADRALRAAEVSGSALAEWNRTHGTANGRRLMVGLGLDRGTAFMGSLGGGGRQVYTIAGQPLETATRLATAADAGEILLGEGFSDALSRRPKLDRVKKPELRGLAAWRLVSEPGR